MAAEDLRILLIDDNGGDRALTAALLREELAGVRIREVDGAIDFAELLGYRSWTVAISELDLGWADGLAVLRTLKQRHPRCLTILFTHASPDAIGTLGGDLGIDGYVHKESTGYLRLPKLVVDSRRRALAGEPRAGSGLRGEIDAVPVGYFWVLTDGTILQANTALAALLGTGSDGLEGRRLTGLLADPRAREHCERALSRGDRVQFLSTELRRADGTRLPAVLSFWPVPDTAGRSSLEGMVWSSASLPAGGHRDAAAPAPREPPPESIPENFPNRFPGHFPNRLPSAPLSEMDPPELAGLERGVADAGAGRGDFESVPLREALLAALERLRPALRASKARFRAGPLPTVQAHRSELVRLFRELLDNAVKYAGESPPQIFVRAEEQADGWLLSVRDNGRGISSGQRHAMFTSPGLTPGSGIAICQSIARRYAGELWITSQRGEGTTVFVALRVGSSEPHRVRLTVQLNGRAVGGVWVQDAGDEREIARAALNIPGVRRNMTARSIQSVQLLREGVVNIVA